VHVTRIRRLLDDVKRLDDRPLRLDRRAGGYVLTVDPDDVDLHRFERLVRQARDPRCAAEERLRALREALALWRGEPLAGLSGQWATRMRQHLRERRLDAMLAWAEAELAVGDPAAVLTPLRELVDEHPLAEPLAATLMRALVATGRQAEALDLFAVTRRRLIDELGTEPARELSELHQAILRGEVEPVVAAPTRDAPSRDAPIVPRQLPAGVTGFAGRAGHLERLDLLLPGDGDQPGAVVISAIAGMGGIGKTALAVHWAHRVAERFPDGQLYVNLRGFDPGGPPMSAGDAVRGFLDAFGVAPGQIPTGLDAQAALYRSLLAGKRVLVVLDNARDAEQVRPLLPGAAGCLALVTSRDQLTSLIAADGARPLTLDVLSVGESRELLARRLGGDRVRAESTAAEEIIAACARLPLALSITAARAQLTGFSLAGIAAELDAVGPPVDAAGPRLDALDTSDPAGQIRAVFSWSYTALSEPAARMFRLLGLHPGPDVSAAAAASLAGEPQPQARRLLTELTRASLLTEHSPGRYGFHDLLRAYAAELATAHDDEPARRAAMTRLLDHYVHTTHNADRLLYPNRDAPHLPVAPPAVGARPEELAKPAAVGWLAVEHRVLLAAQRQAADTGFDAHAWQLAWTMDTFLVRQGHWRDRADAWQEAIRAADGLDDPVARACAYRFLADAETMLGRHAEAHTHYRHALDAYERLGDLVGQADTHRTLALLCEQEGRPSKALDHARRSLSGYQAAGHRRWQAAMLNHVAWYHVLVGEHTEAITWCERALPMLSEVNDGYGQAATWDTLGYAHYHLGNYARAAECYERSLGFEEAHGDRHNLAESLLRMGDARHAAGDHTAARAAWERALDILTDLGHPDAETVAKTLRHLDDTPPEQLAGETIRLCAR
jgi:tetratricopeptide (TPR) repeat protein